MYVRGLLPPTHCRSYLRFSMLSTPPAPHIRNVYVNSGKSAAAGGHSRSLTCFQALSWTLLNGQSPQGVPAMCTKVSLTAPRFVSKDYGFIPWRDRGISNGYVPEITTFSRSHLTKPIGVLQGGYRVETLGAPKHCPPPGRNFVSFPIHFGLDVWRRAIGVHQYAPVCRSTRPCGLPPYHIVLQKLTPPPAI